MRVEAAKRRTKKAGARDRTEDLLITNQLLYHLSYTGLSYWPKNKL